MKTLTLALGLCCLLPAHAYAQLVHLKLQGTVVDRFGGESWWNGAGSGIGVPAVLHVYYDLSLVPEPAEPGVPSRTYRSNGSVNNSWRMHYGSIDISEPFDTIEISDGGLSVSYADMANSFSSLDLKLTFVDDPSPSFDLPSPPLPALGLPTDPEIPLTTSQSSWTFDTGGSLNLESGSLQVRVDRVEGNLAGPFQPVPEPSTYALAATALLSAFVLLRHRTSTRRRDQVTAV